MIYFCADDYGISKASNSRIKQCITDGVLNKVSVLPNGEIEDLDSLLSDYDAKLSLHINLVEGYPLSEKKDVGGLLSDDGTFKYSFAGLFLKSFSLRRKEFEKQLYKEIQAQIRFWRERMGEDTPLLIDSHQHVCSIPMIFKILVKVIEDEKVKVEYMRTPSEPIMPYIITPSLYFSYTVSGILKQWILKILNFINQREFKKLNIKPAIFMGAIFSGSMSENRVRKILTHYKKLAKKQGKDIEAAFHPGFVQDDEVLMDGIRKGFAKFYLSRGRKIEFDALIKLKEYK